MAALQKIVLIFPALILFLLVGDASGKLDKKVHKEIQKAFEVTQYELIDVSISDELNSALPLSLQKGLRRIQSPEGIVGYSFLGAAPSKTAEFDYLVLFDTNLEVIHSKVLVYREEYGGEIGSKRWLRQFNGKGGNDRVSAGTNIDAISGATISVRSMTRAMDKLLQSIGILQQNHIF